MRGADVQRPVIDPVRTVAFSKAVTAHGADAPKFASTIANDGNDAAPQQFMSFDDGRF